MGQNLSHFAKNQKRKTGTTLVERKKNVSPKDKFRRSTMERLRRKQLVALIFLEDFSTEKTQVKMFPGIPMVARVT